MGTVSWYRGFAEQEARGSSPQYEALAGAVADSAALVKLLAQLPGPKRQPNLLFASVRLLGGPVASPKEFIDFVRSNADQVVATMASRSTQTNEVARCAAFVPLLAELNADLALIEVGASAGLCLFPDRYAYRYDGKLLGDSPLAIDVDTVNSVPIPDSLPVVNWRAGLDLNPLDVSNNEDLAWLRACIWPEHDERRRRFDLAAAIVAEDPPHIDRGDLLTATVELIDQAPPDAIKVVFHSAVLAYVDEAGRAEFAATMQQLVKDRDDVVWLSNEAASLVSGIPAGEGRTGGAHFHLGRNGDELIATTDPHGSWISWHA